MELLGLLGVFGLVWAGIEYSGVLEEEEITVLSAEQERRFGERILDAYLSEHREMHTDELDAALSAITNRLLAGMKERQHDYEFYAVENAQINAFTLPGGIILLNSGLIEFSDSPEELAAVIGHEIGHAVHDHVINRIAREIGVTVLLTVITGGDPLLLSEVTKLLTSASFDRSLEREADQYAMSLLESCAINPRVLASLFRRMEEARASNLDKLEFLSTHPTHRARLRAALSYELQSDFVADPFELDWERLRASLSGGH